MSTEPSDATGGGSGTTAPDDAQVDSGDGRVPGEAVIVLAAPAIAEGTDPLAALPVDGVQQSGTGVAEAGGAPTRLGVEDLDPVLTSIGTVGLYRAVDPADLGLHAGGPEVASAEVPPAGGAGGAGGTDSAAAVAEQLARTVVVRFDPQQSLDTVITQLRAVGSVAEVSPSAKFWVNKTPNDPEFSQQWGLTKIRCPEAWDSTTGSSSVKVAVVDTGADLTHPELTGLLDGGANFIARGATPQDDHGHGTHVAGTIAALTDNSQGVAGINWACTIVPVKALNSSGYSVGSSIAQGIVWASSRAQVINLSVGGEVDDLRMRLAVALAVWRGVALVAAMGNFGWGESRPSYPAAYPGVIAVGAVDSSDRRSVWSSTQSSNTGSWISLAAPGTGILSLRSGGGTTYKSGTSMATPHVSGVLALLLSLNSQLSADHLGQIVRETARPLRDDPSDPVPNPSYGAGLLDARAAVSSAVMTTPGDFPTTQPGDSGSVPV